MHSVEADSVVVVVTARADSKRLPRKVFEKIGDLSMVETVFDRAKQIGYPVVLSIPAYDIEDFANRFRHESLSWGPENDLIKRHLFASEGFDHVVRVTGDCPFLDPWAASCTIHTHLEGGYDLTIDQAEGRGVQVYTRALLEQMDREVTDPYEREHLDVWPLRNTETVDVHWMKFSIDTLAELDLARVRITL